MSTLRRRAGWWKTGFFLTVLCLAAPACATCNPFGADSGSGGPNSVVVGAGDFLESRIVAEVYAQALQAHGFDVGRRFGIGSREAYIPALKDGSIDVVPEYLGQLMLYLQPDSTVSAPDAVELAVTRLLPGDLSILQPSPASTTGTVTVTEATAGAWQLATIADLAPHSGDVTFAAPSEFAIRPSGLPGLKRHYGLDIRPANFVPIDDGGGPATAHALVRGTVTAAEIFSTSPAISEDHLVVLADPEHNFPAGNLVPLVSSQKKSDRLKTVLDAVSAKLTTAGLTELNASVFGNSGVDPEQAARTWLQRNDFTQGGFTRGPGR